jgi:DNA-directed RNA polymerase subunit F
MRALASLIRSKPFKRDELFTEIAHEFADSNVIKNSLKAVGFDRLDRLNSEAFMGNAFREAVRNVRKGSGSGFNDVMDYAKVVFRNNDEKIAKFIDDVKNQKVTDETSLYIFNKILDVQPRALTEMPEAYAKHPNTRMFYSMKSYGLKVLDVYRRDVINEKKTLRKAKNFLRLTAILTASGATGAQVRDWYNGKDTKFSDNVLNNFLQLAMFSTYDAANIKRDGLGNALLNKALPPSRWMNDVSQDILSAGDGTGLKSVRNIPIIGAEIYNRIGKGSEIIAKAADTTKAHYTRISGMLPGDQRVELLKLKQQSKTKYTSVVKQLKWDKMGVTSKEKSFASMGVEDGERAEQIAKYLKKQDNWQETYLKLKKAGIITDDVKKQLLPLLK